MIPLRLVVDTNIVVAAALEPDGLSAPSFCRRPPDRPRLFVTEAILGEYRDVLSRAEMKIRERYSETNSSNSFAVGRIG